MKRGSHDGISTPAKHRRCANSRRVGTREAVSAPGRGWESRACKIGTALTVGTPSARARQCRARPCLTSGRLRQRGARRYAQLLTGDRCRGGHRCGSPVISMAREGSQPEYGIRSAACSARAHIGGTAADSFARGRRYRTAASGSVGRRCALRGTDGAALRHRPADYRYQAVVRSGGAPCCRCRPAGGQRPAAACGQ